MYKIAHRAIEKISLGLSNKENIVITGDSGAGKVIIVIAIRLTICSSLS